MTENLKSPDAGLVAEARKTISAQEWLEGRGNPPFRFAKITDLITRLADRLEALSTPPQAPSLDDEHKLIWPEGGWLPINEAPRDGTRVLVTRSPFTGNLPPTKIAWRFPDNPRRSSWRIGLNKNLRFQPTHWQPLPPPPPQDPAR